MRTVSVFLLMMMSCRLISGKCVAEDWCAFRGFNGNGWSDARDVPLQWSNDRNVAWKVQLPGQSNGSPIVSAGRIFLTSAEDDGRKRHLHCFDAASGETSWVRTVEFAQQMPTHKTNLYGGTTPAANGSRVVVWHGSAGLYCYDFDGNELWRRELGEFRHQWGYGTSPVIHEDRVILHSGPGREVFVAAFAVKDGSTLWKTDEPVDGDGERNSANKYMGSWSTPVITQLGGRNVVVCSMATRVNGYDLETGEILWYCEGLRGDRGDLAYTSPVIVGDICVAMGGYQGPAIGFRMQGRGNLTEQQRLWRKTEKNPQRIGTGAVVDGLIYMANAGPNTIECIDPQTGETLWQERSPANAAHWGSMVYADGHLFTTAQNGTTVVFKPNPQKLDVVAVNALDSPGNSTLAVADGVAYVRSFPSIHCFDSRK